ncbi:MAG: GWxTD domain-containing protein [Candidatus Aminicenantes bacterium]|nr:GWxTD domain-containing protein [Candidatus Aminicenantes bacterium]
MIEFQAFRRRAKLIFLPTLAVFFISWLALFSLSCRYYKLEQKLDPENKDWLNRVRYIITNEESHTFLDLPESERERFKEEFWERRDPDPDTEENEFKLEYYNRMEQADDLFVSEGKEGWLTDRGRIYILFGPPMDRITNPMGYNSQSRCQEIWYYGNFPVIFIDSTCTGTYRLVTYDLSSLRSYNLMYMHELNLAQAAAQQTIRGRVEEFSYDWRVEKTFVGEDRIEGTVFISMPYSNIWFSEDVGKLVTTLSANLELKNSAGKLVWQKESSFRIETDEDELKELKGKEYKMEIPFVIDKEIASLREGKNKLFATLTNETGGDEVKKVMNFEI